MSTIPAYPPPPAPLDGTELVLGYAAGLTRRITTASLAALALSLMPAPGAEATSQFNAAEFGIVGDGGATDQTAKVQAMLNAMAPGGSHAGQQVIMPAGQVKVSGNLNASGVFGMLGILGSSALIFTNNAQLVYSGGSVSEVGGPRFIMRNMLIKVSGSNTQSGVISVSFGANAIGSTSQPLLIENCEVSGLTYNDLFLIGIHCHNVPNGYIDNVRFFGDIGHVGNGNVGVGTGTGLSITADVGNATGGWTLRRINAYWMDQGVSIQGHCEGVICDGWNMVFVRHGLTYLDDGATINLLIQITNCFINSQVYCVYIRNCGEVYIDTATCAFYGEKIVGDPNPVTWWGILLVLDSPAVPFNQIFDVGGTFAGNTSPAANRFGVQVQGFSGSGNPGTVRGRYLSCSTAMQFTNAVGTLYDDVRWIGTSNSHNFIVTGGSVTAGNNNYVLTGI